MIRFVVALTFTLIICGTSSDHEGCYTGLNQTGTCQSQCGQSTVVNVEDLNDDDNRQFNGSESFLRVTNSSCPPFKICCPNKQEDVTEEWNNIETSKSFETDRTLEISQEGEVYCADQDGNCPQGDFQNEYSIASNDSLVTSSATDQPGLETGVGFRSGAFGETRNFYPKYDPTFGSPLVFPTYYTPAKSRIKLPYMNTHLSSNAEKLLPNICGFADTSVQISGGQPVREGEIPWMAGLLYYTPREIRSECGGSLITNRHVLTAAHCIGNHYNRFIQKDWILKAVRLGTTTLWVESACTKQYTYPQNAKPICIDSNPFLDVPIQEIIVHEMFGEVLNQPINDIALLRLGEDVQFDKTIRPICLPSSPRVDESLTAAGWGKTRNGRSSPDLLKVEIPLVNCESRNARQNGPLRENQICAGGKSQKDTCFGDSGGPLMGTHETNKDAYRLVGITSFGSRICGTPDWPAVYTRVYDFVPWILEKIQPRSNSGTSRPFTTPRDVPNQQESNRYIWLWSIGSENNLRVGSE